ncbi:IS6 family transposase [Francisella sp. SYW-9]|uniref:IS6 family transposase n=1 Tax=Francisella sp. SYW-9 TaxID=2610888 RepID=UPI00123D97E3|nr:IS6 family transposase [Francisella sp. SYW-9]
MRDFKYKHFTGEVILWAIRWYLKYGIIYRELEEMLKERGIDVDHTTIYRWVIQYSPELKKKLSWYRGRIYFKTLRVDETYIKVKGKWKYLYRAVTKDGYTVDFYLSHTRNTKAAKRFLSKTLRNFKYDIPNKINTDMNPAYNNAISELKAENDDYSHIEHRKEKYLNNIIEQDHGKLKRLIKPMLGFKSIKTANATILGYEWMRMFKKGQFDTWTKFRNKSEADFINELFDVYCHNCI